MNEKISSLPKSTWFLVIGSAIFLMICCICLIVFMLTPPSNSSLTPENTGIQSTSTVLFSTATQLVATEVIPATAQPEPTAEISLNQTLEEFSREYDALTDLQKEDFMAASYGKTVIWEGHVEDVFSEGVIVIENPVLIGSVYLGGIPIDELKSINKNSLLKFTGTIVKELDIDKFYLPFLSDIYLDDVKIID